MHVGNNILFRFYHISHRSDHHGAGVLRCRVQPGVVRQRHLEGVRSAGVHLGGIGRKVVEAGRYARGLVIVLGRRRRRHEGGAQDQDLEGWCGMNPWQKETTAWPRGAGTGLRILTCRESFSDIIFPQKLLDSLDKKPYRRSSG